MPITNNHPVNVGLVLDGHYGWHNHARLIAEAVSLGFPITDDDQAMVDTYDAGETDDDHESIIGQGGIMDDAEAWLNANTPAECTHCGQPVEWRQSGWWTHIGLRGQCPLRMSDTAKHYLWHWSDGEFFLSPQCEDDDCDDDTCAHWSFQ